MLSAGKISCCILTEINPGEIMIKTYLTKTVSYRSTSHNNLQKQNNKDFFFNCSMLGYISPITVSLPHIYRRNSCPTHIFKPTHQTVLQASSHQGIFQTNLPLFGTFVISSTRSDLLHDIL